MNTIDACAARLPLAVLDEIDYPIALLFDDESVYCNAAAREQLEEDDAFEWREGMLRARRPSDQALLDKAVRAAKAQRARQLLAFDAGEGSHAVAVVPVESGSGDAPAAMLMLGRRRVCESLPAWGFAHCCGLTLAEHAVLSQLCARRRPVEIAQALGVALSTVRSHIAGIRLKTGAPSIGDVVATLACLPPLRGAPRR